MKVNILELQTLIDSEFCGNQKAFSKVLSIDRTYLNKIMKNDGKVAGIKFCEAIMKYCNENNKDYQKYIFFNDAVNKNYKKGVNRNVNKS